VERSRSSLAAGGSRQGEFNLSGRKAALPAGNYEPLSTSETRDDSSVILQLEDAPDFRFTFSQHALPQPMVDELLSAVESYSRRGQGRRLRTFKQVRSALGRWASWITIAKSESDDHGLESLTDISIFHIRRFRDYLESKYTEKSVHYSLHWLRKVFEASDLNNQLARQMLKHNPAPVKARTSISPYTSDENRELIVAALRVIREAHARITSSLLIADSYGNRDCLNEDEARGLVQLMETGRVQDLAARRALGYVGTDPAGGYGKGRKRLFMTSHEIMAAAVLLAYYTGANRSTIENATVPIRHDEVWQLNLDKPRRGSKARYWPEIVGSRKAQSVLARIVEATAPARRLMRSQDPELTPETTPLLVYWPVTGGHLKAGLPGMDTTPTIAWVPESARPLHFSRLRRLHTGVEPVHHSPDTNLHYVRTDPSATEIHQIQFADDVTQLAERVQEAFAVNIREEPDETKDTVIAGCEDVEHHPSTGDECTSGYYSFLDCLLCTNAFVSQRHLPRLLAARQVLTELQTSLGSRWDRRFGRQFASLCLTISKFSTDEISGAERDATFHLPLVTAAVTGRMYKQVTT